MAKAEHIVSTPDVLAGLPRVKGTRISVRAIKGFLAEGFSFAMIKMNYPVLTDKQIRAVQRYEITTGELGPITDAAMAGCKIETFQDEGKTTIEAKRRYHLLDQWSRPQKYGKHTSPALITQRQANAGFAVHDAWCETMKGGGPIKEYVQSTPDWDSIAVANADRIGKFARVTQHLPQQYRDVVLQVCNMQIPTDDLSGLRNGLDAVADGLGL